MLCSYITRNQKPFSSSAHSDAIKAAHKELHILSVKVTHGGRVYGRQQLEQCGVDKVSADVAGGWSTGAGEGCYGNGLSRPAMRAMTGFPHDDSAFYLPRASLEPPESLQPMIFPQLDNWIIMMGMSVTLICIKWVLMITLLVLNCDSSRCSNDD